VVAICLTADIFIFAGCVAKIFINRCIHDYTISSEMTSQRPDADLIARKLHTVDEIFGRFLATNTFRGQNQSLEDIMQITRDRTLKYAFLSDHFLADLGVVDAHDTKVIEVRLSNGALPKSVMQRDDAYYAQWICLTEVWLHWVPKMQAAMHATHAITEMWFDESNHRVEVLLEAKNRPMFPRLLVIFTPQYPAIEDEFAFSPQPLKQSFLGHLK